MTVWPPDEQGEATVAAIVELSHAFGERGCIGESPALVERDENSGRLSEHLLGMPLARLDGAKRRMVAHFGELELGQCSEEPCVALAAVAHEATLDLADGDDPVAHGSALVQAELLEKLRASGLAHALLGDGCFEAVAVQCLQQDLDLGARERAAVQYVLLEGLVGNGAHSLDGRRDRIAVSPDLVLRMPIEPE